MKDRKSHLDRIASHLRKIPRSGIRDFFDIVSTRKDIISLGIGEPDFVTPWHIREAVKLSLDQGDTSYTANLGLIELRHEISKYVRHSFKTEYKPETEILITVGVSEALDLAIRAITEPGDELIYHEPCYVSYAPEILFAHGKPVPIMTSSKNDFRLTREMIEPKITKRTKAILLNFPTNPTGSILLRKDVEGIAKLAIERDLLVISDEIYSELTYDGGDRVSIASIPGMKERTIFLNGFSKSWAMTGFRIGFSCAPQELTEAMMKIHQYTMLCASIMAQKAAIEALAHGGDDVLQMKNEYERRRNFIHTSLNEMGLPCTLPRGAFYAFPYIGDYGLTSKEFAIRLLEEKKVACVPGSAFGDSGEGFIRCSYATELDEIKEAMSRMSAFVNDLEKKAGRHTS